MSVRCETVGEVSFIRMIQPERRNAMSSTMLDALLEALDSSTQADGSALVITGGSDVFSAGADVTESVDKAGAVLRMNKFTRLYEKVLRFPKPTVAAIGGHCIGGGAEVASACDLRVGTPECSIRFPGARFGIPVGAARLPLLIGVSHAKDLLMTTRPVGGEEAFRMGFLNRLVTSDELEDAAADLAGQMASNPGALDQKRLVDTHSDLTLRTYSEGRALRRWQQESSNLMGDR